jgi:Oxidoreductase NAD-binding domain
VACRSQCRPSPSLSGVRNPSLPHGTLKPKPNNREPLPHRDGNPPPFKALPAPHTQIYYLVDKASSKAWRGGVGYVTADVLSKHLPPPSGDHLVLVCGPPGLMNAVSGDKAKDKSQGEWHVVRASLKPVGHNSLYSVCRIGHLVPIWQPLIGSSLIGRVANPSVAALWSDCMSLKTICPSAGELTGILKSLGYTSDHVFKF